jgi:hypothetical protein
MKIIIDIVGLLLIVLIFNTIKSSNAKVSCPICKAIPYDDIAQHMYNCKMQEYTYCSAELAVIYKNKGEKNQSCLSW